VADLRRFWIRLSEDGVNPSRRGYGVTAFDESDALAILRHLVFQDDAETMPEVVELVPDVNVRDLDQGHVVPNMNPPNWRGIWFPKGYDRQLG
jgi:hypothetical protein